MVRSRRRTPSRERGPLTKSVNTPAPAETVAPAAKHIMPKAAALRLRSSIFPAKSNPNPQPTAAWDNVSKAAEVKERATGLGGSKAIRRQREAYSQPGSLPSIPLGSHAVAAPPGHPFRQEETLDTCGAAGTMVRALGVRSAQLPMSNPLYALVLAGGSGTRFWPLSRRTTPKQLLRLFSEETLLAETVRRLDGLVPPDQVLVLTNREQEAAVRAALPDHPPENIFSEPAKRDTAAAIALGVGLVAARNADATMAVLPADARIADRQAFQNDLRVAAEAAETKGDLVTIGITPTWACPGFGYIEKGDPLPGKVPDLYQVARFREKPNPDLAESFFRSGNFFWNAGIFIWTVRVILNEFNRHAADLGEFVAAIRHTRSLQNLVEERFPTLRKISVDYAILEKSSRVAVKAATFDWDDVGSWTALGKYLDQKGGGNAANCSLTVDESANNIVFSDGKLHVALLGVNDLVVVQTGDALLVCNRHEVENVKRLVGNLPGHLQ